MKNWNERQVEIVRSKALLRFLCTRIEAKSAYGFETRLYEISTGNRWSGRAVSNRWKRVFNGKQPLTSRALRELAAVFPDAREIYSRGPFDIWGAMWGDLRALSAIATGGTAVNTLGILLTDFEADILQAEANQEPLSLSHLVRAVALHRLARGLNAIIPLDVDLVGSSRCVCRCLNDDSVIGTLAELGVLDDVRSELGSVVSDAQTKIPSAALNRTH